MARGRRSPCGSNSGGCALTPAAATIHEAGSTNPCDSDVRRGQIGHPRRRLRISGRHQAGDALAAPGRQHPCGIRSSPRRRRRAASRRRGRFQRWPRDRELLVNSELRLDDVLQISCDSGKGRDLLYSGVIIASVLSLVTFQRYLPSEFGFDVGRLEIMEPAKTPLGIKAKIRQAIKDEGIPYTFICSNFASGYYYLSRIGQIGVMGPPTDKVFILGDGNLRVIFVKEEDTATYAIKSVDDPRALNKILYVKPPADIYSHNELITLWEKKTGNTFERIYVSEEEVLKKIQELPPPHNFGYALAHAAFVKGEMTNFEIDPLVGAEASTVDEYLDRFM